MEQVLIKRTKEQSNFNILFITVQPNTDIIGIKYLHSYLLKNNISSRILILPNYDKNMNGAIKDFFDLHNPSLVGIGLLSNEFPAVEKLLSFIKLNYNIPTLMGGIHATISPDECINYVDYVIRGEAEGIILEICKRFKNGASILNMPNLVYKVNDIVIKNPILEPEKELDKFPFHENLPKETYVFNNNKISLMDKKLFRKYSRYNGKFYSLTTSRGCNLKCSFCINSFYFKMYKEENLTVPKIRSRSVDNCIEELKLVKKQYPDTVYIDIQDDNFFGHDVEWIKEFSRKYKKEIDIPICARAVPIFMNEEKAKLMKEAGLTWVFMGLQTGSQRIQYEIYQRYITNEQFLKSTKIIHKYGFVPYYDVILDNQMETDEDILQTIDVLLKIEKPYQLQMLSLTYFPGTVIYDIAKEKGIDVENPLTKNFDSFKKTLLNQIIRLIPLLPGKFIKFIVKNRHKTSTKILIKTVYYPCILTLEPITWLKLINLSFDGNIKKTFKMIKSFAKTGFEKMILRK